MSMDKPIDILGLGFCGLDTLCLVPSIPLDSKVEISHMLIQGGGPAATATVTASRLGLRTAFAGVTGDDDRGTAILREFDREGVNTDGVLRRSGCTSPAAFCWVEETNGSRSIAWTHGDVDPLGPDELRPDMVLSAKALQLDGHQTDAAIRSADLANAAGMLVFLDAGTLVPRIGELISRCTVVIASLDFAQRFTGSSDPEAALRALRRLGPAWTGVTMGAEGSVGFDGSDVLHQGIFPVPVVDTTGAGDVYHGAFAARYVECASTGDGPDLRDCMRFASVAAGLKCRSLGGRTGIPDRAELDRAIETM